MMALSPILVEAVSFLFDEGKKFLQERRARAEASKNVTAAEPEITSKSSTENAQLSETITSKEVALNQEVPQSLWTNSEAKVKHLTTLLKIYTRNYYLAKEQEAMWGKMAVPPFVANNLIESENAVAETIKSLENELSKVYGKKIVVPEA